ncbi:Os02g0575600 [Oryza sativa Japonica Group]|uniref:Os02g0575600 protein n=1 Tax=Oryza sativa subsp. japonica TaxID=39947 RepID=Q69JW9_ORYSJ|nr:hypothetical protein [Oryza sativa Japonica Group]BAD34243.1 hypothetical protein [Oryza sativa Japonica Group]BAH91762.1 Os02g0575600 [Oryza sativa Japonica Group]|eukprot:NP_001173033.1 Os02g0575600 [Oryza sativa Japonica Group]
MPGSTAVERGVGLVVEVTLAVAGLVVVVAGGRVKSGKPSANEIKIRIFTLFVMMFVMKAPVGEKARARMDEERSIIVL